jgi:hypothetical protein
MKGRIDRIRKIIGGSCHCGKFNTHSLKYKMGEITLLERYCSETCANSMNE